MLEDRQRQGVETFEAHTAKLGAAPIAGVASIVDKDHMVRRRRGARCGERRCGERRCGDAAVRRRGAWRCVREPTHPCRPRVGRCRASTPTRCCPWRRGRCR
eukprot:6094080-Prymnesium_polylepis.1